MGNAWVRGNEEEEEGGEVGEGKEVEEIRFNWPQAPMTSTKMDIPGTCVCLCMHM